MIRAMTRRARHPYLTTGLRAFVSRHWPLLGAFAITASASSAHAATRLEDGRGLDLRLFRPPADPDGYLSVNGTQGLRPWELGFRLTLDAGFGLVPVAGFEWNYSRSPERAKETSKLVDTVATGVLGVNVGVVPGLVVGAALAVEHVAGRTVVVPAVYNDRADRAPERLRSTGLGDLEISGKYSFSEVAPGALTVPATLGAAGVLRLSVPTGNTDHLRGEPGVTVWPSVVGEYAPLPFFRTALELGYRFVSGDGAELPAGGRIAPVTSDADRAPELRYTAGCSAVTTTATCPGPVSGGRSFAYDDLATLGIGVNVAATQRLGVLAEWYAVGVLPALGERHAISGEAALGVRYQLASYVSVTLAAALGAPRGLEGSTGRGIFSLIVAPTDADLDRDGYATRDDACADSAEDFDGFEDSDGCPDEDNDRDKLPDAVDACPNDPGSAAGAGCPLGRLGDRDGDGSNDYRDACPNDPGPAASDGCPPGGAGTRTTGGAQ